MADVDDVAAEVIVRTGPISTYKLQKLVYYCQAWHLVWDEEPLFANRIEAWANGPVSPTLYDGHRGRFTVSEWPKGDRSNLTESEAETVEAVVKAYGDLSGQQLSQITHSERPWREARAGLTPGQRGNAVISTDSMYDYYSSLAAEDVESLSDFEPF
ncbi:MAG TPA: type II toxin-antitoxin system antitoxin SocA domain-containing protein [Acidimicrobiales bacterium]|nr:type II toxin-antitoxin system antitoxin SocA domain-containing protein [Acidimicrobiales bacterium]